MFAQLGTLVFDTVGPLTGLESRQEFGFAEHPVIEGKPRLQYIGDELESLTMEVTFASAFSDPGESVSQLRAISRAHEAVALLFGTGEFRGSFVVREVEETLRETDPAGAILRVTCRVQLTEYFDPSPEAAAERRRRQEAEATSARSALAFTAPAPRVVSGPKEGVPTATITRWGG